MNGESIAIYTVSKQTPIAGASVFLYIFKIICEIFFFKKNLTEHFSSITIRKKDF